MRRHQKDPEGSCLRKRSYRHRFDAISEARHVARKNGMGTDELIYLCPICQHFHVGKPNGADLKSIFRGERRRR